MRRAPLFIAAAVCAAIVVAVVSPVSLEDVLRGVTSTLGPYTYGLVGALAFLETAAAIGLIAPGELAVILGGVAAGRGEIELVPLIAIVWVCAVAGDLVSYGLGRRLGREFLLTHGQRIRITPERLARVERYFGAHGGKTIIVGRFIGLVRALAPAIAGASHMPLRRFVPATVVGAGAWAIACASLGYVSWASLDQALSLAKQSSLVIGGLVAVGAMVAVALRRRRGPAPDGGP